MNKSRLVAVLVLVLLARWLPAEIGRDDSKPYHDEIKYYKVPGVQGGVYYFFESGNLYYGADVLFFWDHRLTRSDRPQYITRRARTETFASVGFYYSDVAHEEYLFSYLLGFNVSFESASTLRRDFLIPYLGLSAGGVTMKEQGAAFMLSPMLGISVVSLRALSVSVDNGLVLSPAKFEEYLALRTSVTLLLVL